VLEPQAPNLPEQLRDLLLLLTCGEVAPIPGHRQRPLHVLVDEAPAHLLESRDVVAVDDVDSSGAMLPDESSPLVCALPAADD
jgi:hypothetical protein